MLGAGDMFMMFNDRDEVRAVIEFLATPEAARAVDRHRRIRLAEPRPCRRTGTPCTRRPALAEILATHRPLRFDASDLMPAEVGQRTFWEGMVDWVAADGTNTEDIFQAIEASWPAD